ncbi:MAG TPA: hypothetical protein VFV54_06165 [Thermoanaerobaculia bacterium]|nr:hypothetical protein [Thermoanaerobaculia bacterium]
MRFPVALLIASVLAACSSLPTPIPSVVTVELDAFSGRPNPTWSLTPAEVRDVAKRLRDLPATDRHRPDTILGYRGFRIANPGDAAGVPKSVYVSRGGLIRIGERATYLDAHDLERALIEQAKRRGHGAVFAP